MSEVQLTLSEMISDIAVTDPAAASAALERHANLAKPPGSLGGLEALGARLSAIAGRCPPPVPARPTVIVAAGDHGVHAQGVTRWPQAITAMMVDTMAGGGAAASVLAGVVGASVRILDAGVLPGGTRDLSQEAAMSLDEAQGAVSGGITVAREVVAGGADLILTGDLGMANTTPSACLVAHLTGSDPAVVVGPGAANDEATVVRKRQDRPDRPATP